MRVWSKAAAVAIAIGAIGIPAAKAQTPRKGGAVHAVVQPEPPTLMQALNQNATTNLVAGSIYESLLRYGPDLKPQPSLAKSWSVSPDGKVYTFVLQQGVTWHDGKPFSADDVVFSLDKFDREVDPRWRPIANNQIAAIEKVDDDTVRITLKQPFGPLLLALDPASAPIVPKHIYDGTDYRANPMNNTPIGTGPFKLKEWKRGSFIHLVKNDAYWLKDRPNVSEIYWHVIPDASARAVAYETGKVDVLPGGSVDVYDVERLSRLPNTCMTTKGWEMMSPIAWIALNLRNGILGNKQFRQGLMYAMDREAGRDVINAGFGKVATGPIASKTRFYTDKVNTYGYDPQKAKQLIKASGYKGETIKLMGLPYGESWNRWAEAVKQNLAEVGVNIELVSLDVAGWTQRIGNFDFDMTFNYLYQLGDPAIGVARTYISSNIVKGNPFGNVEGYANPAIDKLFSEAAVAPTDAERQKLYDQVQQIMTDELPVLWLLELEFPTIHRCTVKNLVTTGIGLNDGFRDAWKE